MKRINKKAQLGDLTIWLYRFFLITVVAVVFIIVLSNFLYSKFDSREAEAVLLEKRVLGCLIDNGFAINESFNSDALKKCVGFGDLNKDEINNYYVSAKLTYSNESIKAIAGSPDIEVLCSIEGNAPVCKSNSYYVLVKRESAIIGAKLDLSIAILKVDQNYMNI